MSFFISVLHRVNFSVDSRSIFSCPYPPPRASPVPLYKGCGQRSNRRLGTLAEVWRHSLARMTPPDMALGWVLTVSPGKVVLDVHL